MIFRYCEFLFFWYKSRRVGTGSMQDQDSEETRMTTTVLEPQLLTAEEYAHLPDDGRLTELVSGRIVETNS